MTDKNDLARVLADLVRAAFDYNTTDSQHYAERVAEKLDLIEFEDDGDGGDQGRPFLPPAEKVRAALTEALGLDWPALTASASVPCAGYNPDPDEPGLVDECTEPSRFVVWRSDFDTSYGINGGSEEACERHLAEAVAGMTGGDESIRAVVAVRWDAPPEDGAVPGGQ